MDAVAFEEAFQLLSGNLHLYQDAVLGGVGHPPKELLEGLDIYS